MSSRFRKRPSHRRRRLQRDNLKKGIYILPNLFTSASLFAGFYSIVATLNGDFRRAAWAIVVSALCDAADGRIARMTATTSKFGVEYDSLADLTAFGLAPGILVYEWALRPYGKWGWSAAFLYVVCGALRLARYNVQIDTVEAVSFKGLPIPASAGMIVTSILLFYKFDGGVPTSHPVILLVMFLLSFLMVSNVKFSSFKELDLHRRKPFTVLLAIILLLILVVNEPQIVLFTLAVIYVLHGPVWSFILWRKKRRNTEAPGTEQDPGIKGTPRLEARQREKEPER